MSGQTILPLELSVPFRYCYTIKGVEHVVLSHSGSAFEFWINNKPTMLIISKALKMLKVEHIRWCGVTIIFVPLFQNCEI